ncbi:DUF167 domain-containing protein [Patescibacteria group bacterium]|nr:DUF167 domain-containing protein [Patescibacteria group bacterium]
MKIFVKAKPGAKEESVVKIDENHFEVQVKEPPKQGRANSAIAKALKEYLGKEAKLVSGFASRQKVFEIAN